MDIPIGNGYDGMKVSRLGVPNPFTVGIRQWVKMYQLPIFTVCCSLITLIGVLDTWLVVKYANSIYEMEENPICLILIRQDPYDLMVFVYGKAIGLVVVNSVLLGLFYYWRKVGVVVTYGVTLFQLSLLAYLYVLSDIPHYCRVYLN